MIETANERRRRKLKELCDTHGRAAVAQKAGLSSVALEQILKGVLLPAKADGTRSPRALGDKAAQAIEKALGLPSGWMDTPDVQPTLGDDALAIAHAYAKMTDPEKLRFRRLMLAAGDAEVPGMSDFAALEAPKRRRKDDK